MKKRSSWEKELIKSNCPRCSKCDKTFPRNDKEREVVTAFQGTLENHLCYKPEKTKDKETKRKNKKESISINQKRLTRMSCQTCGNKFAINSFGNLEAHNCNNPHKKRKRRPRTISGGGANGTGKRR